VPDPDAPWHAHVYYEAAQRAEAEALRGRFAGLTGADSEPQFLYVGRMVDGPIGPHPLPQFESHFAERWCEEVMAMIEPTGLRALIHPLTDDDLADHTVDAQWIGEPLALDLSVLDPPGANQGAARFGTSDF
jgi:aromatic ring-cleaving dioxygenase